MKFLLKAVSNVEIIVIFVPKIILMALIVSDAITYQKKYHVIISSKFASFLNTYYSLFAFSPIFFQSVVTDIAQMKTDKF